MQTLYNIQNVGFIANYIQIATLNSFYFVRLGQNLLRQRHQGLRIFGSGS